MTDKMKPVYCLAIVYENGEVYCDSSIKTEVQLSGLLEHGAKASIRRVKIDESKKRSPSASALFHIWCQQLSGFTGNDIVTQKAALKIQFGYPILRANDEMWPMLKKLFVGVGWQGLQYEEKVKYSELIPCTSIMSAKELKQMMDEIKAWAINQFGIELTNNWRGQQ